MLHSHYIPRVLLATNPSDVASSPLLRALQDIFVQLLNPALAPAPNVTNPKGLLQVLRTEMEPLMSIYEQNDMQEFLIILLERMVDAISKISPQAPRTAAAAAAAASPGSTGADADAANQHWHSCMKPDYSIMKEAIYGQTVTRIACGHCGKQHFAHDIFTTLMLPITHATRDVRDCMNTYASPETLAPSEWKCDACRTPSDKNTRSVAFTRLPHVLILCLNRSTSETMHKNDATVELPPELYVAGSEHSKRYRLASVACHSGNAMSGHYYAICRHFDHVWYRIDDSLVFALTPPNQDLPDGATRDAYVVFYTMDELL
jgi:ubiquitin C-terminal hydrolase